uniref:Fe/B12 periplasmic-binding domain-containing protein n=1 Tax=Rhodosorus marinus TaxID=101924 RepID=A0A7S3EKN6_9RHOD
MGDEMRILSLLPSCTQIVLGLSLREHLVGVTHECEIDGNTGEIEGVERVTSSVIPIGTTSQRDIDLAVKTSVSSGISLYTIDEDKFARVNPTLILTQNLCSVCAPTKKEVQRVSGIAYPESCAHHGLNIVSLEPTCLDEVADTFMTVADECQVHDRGIGLKEKFYSELHKVENATNRIRENLDLQRPTLMLLEWLDPPFDGGHWVPDMVEIAGCIPPDSFGGKKRRSLERSWEDIVSADPEVILVACCGFDLERNFKDATEALFNADTEVSKMFQSLRAARYGRVFAVDANQYFAQPAPQLSMGTALMARLAYDNDDRAVALLSDALGDLIPAEGEGWKRLKPKVAEEIRETEVKDIESVWELHDEAVKNQKLHYIDPETGLFVFTSLAHKRRGRCCGSGCRHCPFGHENVSLEKRSELITQASFLNKRRVDGFAKHRYVVFFSTGKDSFLALRQWIALKHREDKIDWEEILDRIVLLTSFDGTSKKIAHQDTTIDDARRQAKALDLSLLAVPLHPGKDYVRSIGEALDLVRAQQGAETFSLVFGDLRLELIKDWRDKHLGHLGILEYPLFGVDYDELFQDLKLSGVPCTITSCEFGKELHRRSCDEVYVGREFDAELREACIECGWDDFGEDGEFHTLARVWEVDSKRALGLLHETQAFQQ